MEFNRDPILEQKIAEVYKLSANAIKALPLCKLQNMLRRDNIIIPSKTKEPEKVNAQTSSVPPPTTIKKTEVKLPDSICNVDIFNQAKTTYEMTCKLYEESKKERFITDEEKKVLLTTVESAKKNMELELNKIIQMIQFCESILKERNNWKTKNQNQLKDDKFWSNYDQESQRLKQQLESLSKILLTVQKPKEKQPTNENNKIIPPTSPTAVQPKKN